MTNIRETNVSDDDLPAPTETYRPPAQFEPHQSDWLALDTFFNTGGSISEAVLESGLSVSQVVSLTRQPWWREQLAERGFVPVSVEEIGEHLAKGVGMVALDRVVDKGEFLPTADLVRLGNLGVSMAKQTKDAPTNQVTIGSLLQIDMRGMDPEQLRALTGGDVEIVDL